MRSAGEIKAGVPAEASHTPIPGGRTAVVAADGRKWVTGPGGHMESFEKPGMRANFREDGHVRSVHRESPNGERLTVVNHLHGGRETVVERPGGVRVVSYGGRRGFVEGPMTGRPGYMRRSYVVDGHSYAHVYRGYGYRGHTYYRYVPAYRYSPGFYRYAYGPWRTHAMYAWGWGPEPWYGCYGGYFAPEPYYAGPSLWLTDFLLAENLRTAYEERQQYASEKEAAPAGEEGTGLTPDVKEQIAAEVQRQLAEEQAAPEQTPSPAGASAEARPPALDPRELVFVVSNSFDVKTDDGAECGLSPGDVITRNGEPDTDNLVPVSVLTAKQGGCDVGTTAKLSVEALQEMHNSFREKLDAGMQKLAESQGKNGLPPSPVPPQARPNPDGTAPPDPEASSTVVAQNTAGEQAEKEVQPGSTN
jgi:hypothetical protein